MVYFVPAVVLLPTFSNKSSMTMMHTEISSADKNGIVSSNEENSSTKVNVENSESIFVHREDLLKYFLRFLLDDCQIKVSELL